MNLEEMTTRAAVIFSGRCTHIRYEQDAVLGTDVTRATFRVQQAIKGDLGPTIEVKFLGGQNKLAGIPTFRKGEEVVLFLYGTSALGFSSPVGLGQGKFTVVTDKRGRKHAINEFRNANLARGLSADAPTRLTLSAVSSEGGRGLEPSQLLNLAKKLVARGKADARR